MLDFSRVQNYYIACGYTDMRKQIDGLAALVQTQFGQEMDETSLYLFCGRRADRIKALYWDGTGYKTPWICKQIFDSGRIASLPYKRPMTKKGNLPWYDYVFDEFYDCILCPQNKVLSYATTNREGYREYKSKSYVCKSCPIRERCTQSRQCTKIVERHIWHEYIERAEDVRHSPIGKATYALRSQTIERVFADAKEKHAMRYTPYRGLTAVSTWVKLKFAAMNLKRLAIHKWMLFRLFRPFSCLKPCCPAAIGLL